MGRRVFSDRVDAGERLADELATRRWVDPVVYGLARGGVPVAAVVAERLGAPLEVAVARKIGAPRHAEFGVGAVMATGPAYYDKVSLEALGLTVQDMADTEAAERARASRRRERYSGDRAPTSVRDRDVIVVDDGVATGVTAKAALRALRTEHPHKIVLAAPVCSPTGATSLLFEADDVVWVTRPLGFRAVGQWYVDFRPTTDAEVCELLKDS